MIKKRVVRTREELLQILDVEKLPNNKKEMLSLMNELAIQKVDLQDESLKLMDDIRRWNKSFWIYKRAVRALF